MIYLLRSKIAKIILSIIWGLGLASLFKRTCHDRECIVYNAPDPATIINNTYQYDKTCYKFDTKLSRCGSNVINS